MNLFNQKSTQFFRCLIYNKKTSGGSATHHHRCMQYFESYKFSLAKSDSNLAENIHRGMTPCRESDLEMYPPAEAAISLMYILSEPPGTLSEKSLMEDMRKGAWSTILVYSTSCSM